MRNDSVELVMQSRVTDVGLVYNSKEPQGREGLSSCQYMV